MIASALASWPAGTPLDDFLAGDERGRLAGDLRTLGEGLEIAATLVAVGVLALLIWVHRGTRAEIRRLLTIAGVAGVALAVGATLELIGIARQFEVGFGAALELDAGSAAMLRLVAGVMLLLGLVEHTSEAGDADLMLRWQPASSPFGVVGALLAAMSYAFDGHTLTEGVRPLHAVANGVHVVAGGVWVGGIVGLVVLSGMRRRAARSGELGTAGEVKAEPLAVSIVRFSSVATVALIAVALAGVVMATQILDHPGDLTDSDWGKRLIVKLVAVGVAAAIGGYNHFALVPAIRRDPHDTALLVRITTMLQVELIVLCFVVVTTVWLINGSPVAGGG